MNKRDKLEPLADGWVGFHTESGDHWKHKDFTEIRRDRHDGALSALRAATAANRSATRSRRKTPATRPCGTCASSCGAPSPSRRALARGESAEPPPRCSLRSDARCTSFGCVSFPFVIRGCASRTRRRSACSATAHATASTGYSRARARRRVDARRHDRVARRAVVTRPTPASSTSRTTGSIRTRSSSSVAATARTSRYGRGASSSSFGIDADLVIGRRVPPGAENSRHAWILFRDGGDEFLFEPVIRDRATAVRRVTAVRAEYIPEFGVACDRRRFCSPATRTFCRIATSAEREHHPGAVLVRRDPSPHRRRSDGPSDRWGCFGSSPGTRR